MDWLHHFRSKKHNVSLEEEIIANRLATIKKIENTLSRTSNTPDVADLSNKIGAVIFVYNDLMKKRRDHELLEPLAFGGDAYTVFEVNGWYRKKDQLPIILRPQILHRKPEWSVQKNAHSAIIKGEVYVVKANKLHELDLYHDNGVQFIRQRIDITIPFEEDLLNKDHIIVKSGQYHHMRKVWAYIGNPFHWWGEADPFSFATGNGLGHPERIDSVNFTPMPIFTPKKTWKSLYYYHAKYPFKDTPTL
jgi:gamma-glutamylcyclotransferase (GGCT)/AIG2-like uncharacterized protein YtfP